MSHVGDKKGRKFIFLLWRADSPKTRAEGLPWGLASDLQI